jgi:hypothetical protein
MATHIKQGGAEEVSADGFCDLWLVVGLHSEMVLDTCKSSH